MLMQWFLKTQKPIACVFEPGGRPGYAARKPDCKLASGGNPQPVFDSDVTLRPGDMCVGGSFFSAKASDVSPLAYSMGGVLLC